MTPQRSRRRTDPSGQVLQELQAIVDGWWVLRRLILGSASQLASCQAIPTGDVTHNAADRFRCYRHALAKAHAPLGHGVPSSWAGESQEKLIGV